MSPGAPEPLRLHDYSLTAMATGLVARNARELAERIERAPAGSLVHHFWGRLLRSDPVPGEYGNDLAEWAARRLGDLVLGERLAWIDPLRHADVEELRERVCAILEERLEEDGGRALETRPEEGFHFVANQMVVYDLGRTVEEPEGLPDAVEILPDSSLFLHFVHPPALGLDDALSVTEWLRGQGFGYRALASELESIDVFLASRDELRQRIRAALATHLDGAGAAG